VNDGPLHLACGGDARYLPHTAACVASFLEHSGDLPLHVHYLHSPGLSRHDRDLFARFVEQGGGKASMVPIGDDQIEGLPAAFNHVTVAMWYRIFLPALLPDVQRVLYVDADTLAMDDVGPLWRTDLDGNTLGAVTNVFEPWDAGYPRKLGLSRPYFNSGVLLLDLERMRATGAADEVHRYGLEHHSELTWPDQDALNIVLGDERVALDPRWNCMNSLFVFEDADDVFGAEVVAEARTRPGVRHFEGPSVNKPWHYLCQAANREEYFRQRAHTPWPDVRIEGRTLRNVVKRARQRIR